jgi:argininosuccinate lyase
MNADTHKQAHQDGKLWGGRFAQAAAPALDRISRSPRQYFVLAPEDIAGSVAHLGELQRCQVISASEYELLTGALREIEEEFLSGTLSPSAADEDIHGFLERCLIERVGPVGGKIRAGRSRNDQTSNDLRLWLRKVIPGLAEDLLSLVRTLVKRSVDAGDIVVPGFTHLQPAQPILFSHQLLAHAQILTRDLTRLRQAWDMVQLSPLGAAALAGTTFHSDQQRMAEEMGYSGVVGNSIDAVSSRDHVTDFLYACASIGTNLSRLSDELILWASQQFGWVKLDDSYATGSSIMPQKKNPDIPELTRGKASRLQANLVGLLGMVKSVPFSYNRDFSDDKHFAFDSAEVLSEVLPAIDGFVETMTFVPDRMREQARLGFTLATELADWLSEQGIPFSEAHDITGQVVVYCESQGIGIDELPLAELQKIDERISADAVDRLTLESAIERRSGPNGTAYASQNSQRDRLESEIRTRINGFISEDDK